jgi:hypothetical protein
MTEPIVRGSPLRDSEQLHTRHATVNPPKDALLEWGCLPRVLEWPTMLNTWFTLSEVSADMEAGPDADAEHSAMVASRRTSGL